MALMYLDICCFNRPFDDQFQLLIRLQTEAKLAVQDAIRQGVHQLVWSAVLDLENAANPDLDRRKAIDDWKSVAVVDIETSQDVEALAMELACCGIKPMDALHLASAIRAGALWFLTTDHALLRKGKHEKRLKVVDPIDPIDFIRLMEVPHDEN
jgi:predicted nucleic acid-binding protein